MKCEKEEPKRLMSYKEYKAKLDLLWDKREEYGYTELFNEKTRTLRAEIEVYEYYSNLFRDWAFELISAVQDFLNILQEENPEIKKRAHKYMAENCPQAWHEYKHNEDFQRWNEENVEDLEDEEG